MEKIFNSAFKSLEANTLHTDLEHKAGDEMEKKINSAFKSLEANTFDTDLGHKAGIATSPVESGH